MKTFKQFLIENKRNYSSLKRSESEISDASIYDLWKPGRTDTDSYNTSEFPAFSHRYDRTAGDMSKLGFSYAVAAENETLGSPEIERASMVQRNARKGIPAIGAGQIESMKNKMENIAVSEPTAAEFKTFDNYKTQWWDWFGKGGMQSSGYNPEKFNVKDLEDLDVKLNTKWNERNKNTTDKDELWRAGPHGREPLG